MDEGYSAYEFLGWGYGAVFLFSGGQVLSVLWEYLSLYRKLQAEWLESLEDRV